MRERRELMGRPFLRRIVVAAGAAVGVASVARADAPGWGSAVGPQYDKFDSNSHVILDLHTNLTWERTAPPGEYDFQAAWMYCAALTTLGKWTSGWRLPSYKELLTIVDESPHVEYDMATNTTVYKAIDFNAFGFDNTPVTAPYWSSSLWTGTAHAGEAFVVWFDTGRTDFLSTGVATFVRCVHDP
jgi:hypothetical protein